MQIAVMDLYGDTPKEYHNEIDLKIYVRKELLRPMIL